jgi:hypothetical protein
MHSEKEPSSFSTCHGQLSSKKKKNSLSITSLLRNNSVTSHKMLTIKISCKFSIPSWSNEEWESHTQDPSPLSSNVIVTSNNFANKVHCDQDKNIFTYGIFRASLPVASLAQAKDFSPKLQPHWVKLHLG